MAKPVIERIEAHEGEYGYVLQLYLKNHDGDAVTSLAGTETVELWVKTGDSDPVQVGSGTVHDTSTGELRVTIESSDVANLTAGLYRAQVEISSATVLLITEDIEFAVKRRLGS